MKLNSQTLVLGIVWLLSFHAKEVLSASNATSTNDIKVSTEPQCALLPPDYPPNEGIRAFTQQPIMEATTLSAISFPPMPPKIRAMIHEEWDTLDPKGSLMIAAMSKLDGAVEFAHARTTFYDHLKGTFSLLSIWNQPEAVRRTGLVHTAYSGDLFQFYLFDSNDAGQRDIVRDLLGEEAEALTYLFGTVNRGNLCHFKDVVNCIRASATVPTGNQTVEQRGMVGELQVTPNEAANILMVTIADYMDQMVDTNGWRDHHQEEDGGDYLYPGDGKPALGFYWFSSVCNAIKGSLEVTPPIFNHCETVISYESEKRARDSYWKVILEEKTLSEDDQMASLKSSIIYNEFVAEPHIMLSQIYFRQRKYFEAATQAQMALNKFYTLGTAWDKRRDYGHWIGFGRSLLLRSNRKMEGKICSFPCTDPNDPVYINHNGLKLIDLQDLVSEMREREE